MGKDKAVILQDDRATVGSRIRERRKQMGLSLQAVADRVDLSVGYLSQIERELSSPSIAELVVIATALHTPATEFLEDHCNAQHDSFIVRNSRRGLTMLADGVTKQRLTPLGDCPLQMFILTLEPGGHTGATSYAYIGLETGLVQQGRLIVCIDDQEFLLSEGDSFRFSSTRPHRFVNAFDGVTRFLWVGCAPWMPDAT